MTLTVDGPPRTKKNGQRAMWRTVNGAPRRFMVPSAAAVDYATRVKAAFLSLPLADRAACPIPKAEPLHVCALFYVDVKGEQGDLHGYQQSLADALEGAGALANDRSIRSWDGTRVVIGDPHPRTELTISPPFAARRLRGRP